MRIERNGSKPSLDVLRSRVSRHRAPYYLLSWWLSPSAPSNTRVLDELTSAQRRDNTTRGATPGLINPARGIDSERIPHPRGDDVVEEESSDSELDYTATGSSGLDLAEALGADPSSTGYDDSQW